MSDSFMGTSGLRAGIGEVDIALRRGILFIFGFAQVGGQREAIACCLVGRGRIDDLDVRLAYPLALFEIAHVLRRTRPGLRHSLDFDRVGALFQRRETHSVRKRAHEFVEHVHHLRTARLQLFDDLLALQKLFARGLQRFDFLDFRVEGGDLAFQQLIAVVLVFLESVPMEDRDDNGQQAHDQRPAEHRLELALALLAPLGAPGQ
jgi:hypothetical protein